MNYSLQNSTATSNEAETFRKEAIQLVGSIVKARRYIAREGKEHVPVPEEIKQPVRAHYNAYKNKWPAHGIARFLIRYQNNLIIMATGGRKQIAHLKELTQKAKHYEKVQ